jgi:ATP adenylyltransferase
MKQLWAPWRAEYINMCNEEKSKKQKAKCFLCLKKPKFDYNNLILYRGKKSFIIMNRYPYNAGHLMIAPYRHIGEVEKCNLKEYNEMFGLMQKSIRVLKTTMKPDGFNVGINLGYVAGAGVPGHLHIHVIPRWLGDTNFMPIIGDTKIINEELHKMYISLKKSFRDNG